MATKDVTTSRYARVKEILALAAGNSKADYGLPHQQAPWDLPLDKLLLASLNGVRLIAPEQEQTRSCCAHHPAPSEAAGRAARSGLIQGLRGDPPFDGSQFPRLPWGGEAVAESDIQFISQWIDDGCPPEDRGVDIGTYDVALTQLVIEREGYEVYEGTPNEYKYQHGEIKQRVNLDCMTPAQLEKLRWAFRELYRLNKWPLDARNFNNLALIHQNHCQHGWERFLPWHRVYMYEFEQAIQDQCPDVTLPYWDWVAPQYPTNPIPNALQAFLTKPALDALGSGDPQLSPEEIQTLWENLNGKLFPTLNGFLDAVAKLIGPRYVKGRYRERFIDALLESNSLWYPLRYPGLFFLNKQPSTINKMIHYHYPSHDDIQEIMSLRAFRDFGGGSLYNDSFGFLDQNPHNTMHIWTGGFNPVPAGATAAPADRNKAVKVAGRKFHTREDMYSEPENGDMFSNLTASYDPIFYSVHINVDRLWWEWQQNHPDSNPADLDSVLTPWSYTIRDTLDIHQFGYEYVKSSYVIPVGTGVPVGRFVSKPINVKPEVRSSFQQAEVRLHRVPQLPRSCFVRIFLNLPDANASTPLDDEHYGGYLAIFGHGECYGGPGHCETPPLQPRPFDRRPRSHNTPRNHRVRVTKCARRLFEKGAASLRITLVVIGVDYQQEHELLRLEGVSLNFLD